MDRRTQRVLFAIWPPYEAKFAKDSIIRRIREVGEEELWKRTASRIEETVSKCADLKEWVPVATMVREAELKRKETIERKATTFLCAIAMMFTIMGIITGLLGGQSKAMTRLIYVAIASYFVAFICLLMSAYYAVKVIRSEGLYCLCADEVVDILGDKDNSMAAYIVQAIAGCKMNESKLTIKSNYLSVAEELFLRGLALIGFASVITMFT